MKDKKCIVFSRVSTTQQDVIEQTKQIMDEAMRIGYDQSQQVLIELKESAIKLNADEREGIIQLKEVVEKDSSINCVITWELTRLARRTDVLFQMRDFFIEHDIQWIIMKPYMCLLNTDRTLNNTFSMMLAIFATFAEQEMIIKKERFDRTKQAKKERGEFLGGGIVFGYMVKDKRMEIDENTAPIVRTIFDMCANGHSAYNIGKTLYEENVLQHNDVNGSISFVSAVLRQTAYNTGKTDPTKTNIYPKLIDDETYRRARAQVEKGNSGAKTNTKIIYYCRNIVYDNISKRQLSPISNRGAYRLNRTGIKTVNVSINAAESLGWYLAKEYKQQNAANDRSSNFADATAEWKRYIQKHVKCMKLIKEIDDKVQKIEMRVVNGKLDSRIADDMERQLEDQRKTAMDNAAKYELEQTRLIKLMNDIKHSNNIDFDDYTDEQKQSAVREAIKAMYFEKERYYIWHCFVEYHTGKKRHIVFDAYNHLYYENDISEDNLLNVTYIKRVNHVKGTKSKYE